jgi:hypothetical protein
VAVNCWVTPAGVFGRLGLEGVTDMEDRSPEVTVRPVLPAVLPETAVMVAVPAPVVVPKPPLLIVATDGSDEPQDTCPLRS